MLVAVERGLQALESVVHHFRRNLIRHRCGGGAGAGRVFEAERLGMAHRVDQAQRIGEVLFCLAGEADDEVARQRDVGARRAHPSITRI